MKPSIAAVLGLLIIIGAAALIAPLVSAKTPAAAANAATAEAPGKAKAKAPDKAPSPEEACTNAKAALSAAFAVDVEAAKAAVEAANDAIRKDEGSPEQKALVEATVQLQKATADFQRAAAVFAKTEEEMRQASKTGGRASDGQIAAYIAAQDAAREALKPAQAAEQARAKVAKAYPKLGVLEQAQRDLQALNFRREQATTAVRKACGIGVQPVSTESPAAPAGEAPGEVP